MCGIIGYIGSEEACPILLDGLRRMEYRGYDSAGIAIAKDGHTTVTKRQGKIANLAAAIEDAYPEGHIGIGHTRWATHGAPSEINAHPHQAGPITIVHNGIIENYAQLKAALIKDHHRKFVSDTDTEVLAHLIAVKRESEQTTEAAVLAALLEVEGTFGLAVLDETQPTKVIAARRGSPLLLGIADDALFIASDATAIIGHTDRVVYLEDNEIAICTAGRYKVIDFKQRARLHEEHKIELELKEIEKAGYDHFLLKEIMDQPSSITDILRGRLDEEAGTAHLGGLNTSPDFFAHMTRFTVVACGSARFSALLGQYILERLTGLPVDVEFGSEFRYRDPVLSDGALGIVISQSGETADTLASLRELKRRGIRTLGLVNVIGSTVAREVDGGVYLHSGPEISVASTKAVTNMMIAQILVGLQIGRSRNLSVHEGRQIVQALQQLPEQVKSVLAQREAIKKIALKFKDATNVMFLGRDMLYPNALEGALKLQETSYIHAEAYPAGEMKHGPVALIDDDLPIVFLHPKNDLYDKTRSNLEEVKARGGRLIIIGTQGDKELSRYSDDVIYIPESNPFTQPILASIPLQLFAYYIAVAKGNDVDQPRNLAKSVTVE